MASGIGDILADLQPFAWRGISFPVAGFETDISHDQVQHKWPDKDGAHVEATGRNPTVIRAQCLFRNGIFRGKNEQWGRLYPDVFRQFLVAITTRTSGTLQHPELGPITCKPVNCSFKWMPNRRDGVDASCTWIESLDDTVTEFQDILARPSPIGDVYAVSLELDTQVSQYTNPSFSNPVAGYSFTAAIQAATRLTSTATLLSMQAGGSLNHIIFQAQQLETAVTLLRDVTAWPIVTSCERLQFALSQLKQKQQVKERSVSLYVVPKDMTLGGITVPTKTKIDDLLKLNPTLAAMAIVPAMTVVRYYAAA